MGQANVPTSDVVGVKDADIVVAWNGIFSATFSLGGGAAGLVLSI